jgi:hypothetical protein
MGERVEQLARWWTSASKEERWLLLRATIEGKKAFEADARRRPPQTPTLSELHLAIYLSEAEAGETREG